jgi:predicted nucleic-acid-binding protein
VLRSGDALYLNHLVIREVSWVLATAHAYGTTELADRIAKVLTAAQLVFEDKDLLWQALAAFRASGSDFADCLIAARNAGAGCVKTLTFDKRASRLPQFSLS